MKPTTEFLKAKNDKKLTAFLVIERPSEGKHMRLCMPYSTHTETVFVECPTDIAVDNYSDGEKVVTEICFHTFFSRYRNNNYIETFLNAIKKDSDVSFRVVAFNGSDWSRAHNIVCHKLIGCVDNHSYLLSEYVGADNTASPIKYIPALVSI